MPNTFLTDTFTEASGTPNLLTGPHTGETGATWTAWAGSGGGTAVVNSSIDELYTTSGNVIAYASGVPNDQDYYAEAVMVYYSNVSGMQAGPCVRLDTAAANGYIVIWSVATSKFELYRFVTSGTKVASSPATRTLNNGQAYTVRLHVSGTGATVTLEVYVDGALDFTYSDTSGSRITAINRAGIYLNGSMTSTTGFHISSISGVDVSGPLTGGTLTAGTHTDAVANVTWTAATGGTAPITAQLQRSAHGAGSWSNISGATSNPATDSTVVAGTDYDYRVAYTDSAGSPATAYSNTVNITVNPTATTLTFAYTDLWSNGNTNITSPYSYLAILKLSTDASDLEITGRTSIVSAFATDAQLSVTVNGTPTTLVLTADATDTLFNIHLGTAGTTRTVEIISGLVSKPASTILGSWLKSLKWCGGTVCNITAPSTTNRLLVYGDSICVGGSSDNPETEGFAALLRTTHGYNVMVEGWGYRALYDDCVDSTARAAFVTKLSGYSPSTIYISIGTNDFGLNKWTAASFQTAYDDLLSRLHTAMPSVPIKCQTPIYRQDFSNEATANGGGDTLPAYRTAISNAVSGKSYCTLVAGTAMDFTGKMADPIHPNTAGHVLYATYVNSQITPPGTIILVAEAVDSGLEPNPIDATHNLLTWNAAAGAVGYKLYVNTGGADSLLLDVGDTTSYLHTLNNPLNVTSYQYKVSYYDSLGIESAKSAGVNVPIYFYWFRPGNGGSNFRLGSTVRLAWAEYVDGVGISGWSQPSGLVSIQANYNSTGWVNLSTSTTDNLNAFWVVPSTIGPAILRIFDPGYSSTTTAATKGLYILSSTIPSTHLGWD